MKLTPIESLRDLAVRASKDPNYKKLASVAARNMGSDAFHGNSIAFLASVADESGDEAGVVDEINFCIDLV